MDKFVSECDAKLKKEDEIMNGKALWVVLEAKPGKEAEGEVLTCWAGLSGGRAKNGLLVCN
jgi:hypothetical protein